MRERPSVHPVVRVDAQVPEWVRAIGRCVLYVAVRAVAIGLTVLIGVYAAIWVTNIGGHADEQRKAAIEEAVAKAHRGGPFGWTYFNTEEEKGDAFRAAVDAAIAASDLDQPFILRSFRYFRDAVSFSLGNAHHMYTSNGSEHVIDILKERLPWTILLFGVANSIIFVGGLYLASGLSRRFGSLLDRTATLLVPIFAAPPWFFGLMLVTCFALVLKLLPFGGIVSAPIPETHLGYIASVITHMILPVSALVLATLPHAIYSNRSLFLIHSSDDFVELAQAKGLSEGRLHRRYILRPVLPVVITNFALVCLVSWQAVILTEHVFNWPGIGHLIVQAIWSQDVPVVTGAITAMAYLIGFTALLLDIAYVIVDPRIALKRQAKI